MKRFYALFLLLLVSLTLEAALVQIDGRWSDSTYAPWTSVPEHYDLGCRAMEKNEWDAALRNFLVIAIHYPESPFYSESLFYSGVARFQLEDYDLANKQFDAYLTLPGSLKHFEKVFEYKHLCAEHFSEGSKRHLFGIQKLPKIMPGKDQAIVLYDEVIASVPGREIAALSYFGKAKLLRARREYKESIDALQTLARRFPKHSLSADGYLYISEIYLEQSQRETQDPDLLGLAEINLLRFQKSFPGDERMNVAVANVLEMKEVFAKSLYDTGRFYEKKKKPNASKLYYRETLKRYPETAQASKAKQRLAQLEAL